ncbi:MAG: DUF3892 domain-containing protein [Chloroflexi bacterium]|nr:DUF3892 domain-containing protein [Chloroflexota bacterium]
MADLRVTRTGKDIYGDITALCGSGWQVSKSDAIYHIEQRWHTYFVQDPYFRRADVRVINGLTGKYLRTDPNSSCSDNLDTLPNC